MSIPMSEIERAESVVAATTAMLDFAHDSEKDEVEFRIYADDETFALAQPNAERLDNAEHTHIVRTGIRAAHRHGFEIVVLRLRAAPMRAWMARQGEAADPSAYTGEVEDRLVGDAALRALGLRAADLKAAPRKPTTGRTLAARIARWATDPEADEDMIGELTEELLTQRLDGAVGVIETMLDPEDCAYVRHAMDFVASCHPVGEPGEERAAMLFVSPVLRGGSEPKEPGIPETLQGTLTGIALAPIFTDLMLAPFWVATSTIARLRPSELREAAEALANGQEPAIPSASALERDVCLLGLTILTEDDDEGAEGDDAQGEARFNAWLAAIAYAAGDGQAAPPVLLCRALDLLRRAKLAVADELPDMDDDEEPTVNEALLQALAAHLAGIGSGSALLTGDEDGVVALGIEDGAVDMPPDMLREILAEALLDGGALFVVPTPKAGGKATGHAFVFTKGEVENVSAGDAEVLFADEAPEDWAAAPAAWRDAPALDYDPGA